MGSLPSRCCDSSIEEDWEIDGISPPTHHPQRECWVTTERYVEATWRELGPVYHCSHRTAEWIRVRGRS